MSELASEPLIQGDRERLHRACEGEFVSELASEPLAQGDRERLHRACEGES